MKKILTLGVFCLIAGVCNHLSAQGAGTYDTTFGIKGKVITQINGQASGIWNCAKIQPDGKIVAFAGSGPDYNGDTSYVLRFNKDGSIDKSFGKNGMVKLDMFSYATYFALGLIMPNGKILGFVSGAPYTGDTAYHPMSIIRLNKDGSVDKTFGKNGLFTKRMSMFEIYYSTFELQSDGKIIFGGAGYKDGANTNNGYYRGYLGRVDTTGKLDPTFGTNGVVNDSIHGTTLINGVSRIQNDDKIVTLGGYFFSQTSGQYFVKRRNKDGSMDTTFGTKGVVTYNITGDGDFYGMSIQPDGKIVASAMVQDANGNWEDNVFRFTKDGKFDNSFGTNGVAVVDGSKTSAPGYTHYCTLQTDGKIVVSSMTDNTSTTLSNLVISRLNTDGSVDKTWGNNGNVITNISTFDQAYTLINTSDNKILLAGATLNSNNKYSILLAELNEGIVTGMEENENAGVPKIHVFPNPSSTSVTIQYTLGKSSRVSVSILDMEGREMANYAYENQDAGNHNQMINTSGIAPGLYLCRLICDGKREVVKLEIRK